MSEVTGRLVEFVDALRSKGINVGPSETIDAAAAIEVLGFDNRDVLREGLAATLVRRGGQRDVFDQTFDLYFPRASGTSHVAQHNPEQELELEQLRELLAMAFAEADPRTLDQIAQIAVEFLGQVGVPDTDTAGWSAYQTLDRLAPQTLIAVALAMRGEQGAGEGSGSGSGSGGGQGGGSQPGFADRLARDEVRQAVEAFREMVAAEARRRTAEVRGRQLVTQHAVRTGGNQIDFLSANRHELEELRRQVQPLARKLATRMATKRRRRRRGPIDVRRTVRRSMGTGGIPIKPVYMKPKPSRPELVLLCDVSGSVAGFSQFTMLLVQALSSQFSKVRVFAFVNAMADVTEIVKDSSGSAGSELAERLTHEARVTNWHTSSDYGSAFVEFGQNFMDVVGHRTAVVILGDARNNNQKPHSDVLHQISARSKRTFWLNPEHPSRWGLGDSEAKHYGEIVPMYQCSNIDQLSNFITKLLPV